MSVSFFLVGSVSCFMALWLCLRWWRVKRYWADRGVPHLPPHPVYGSLNFFLKRNIAKWFKDYYDKFRSPYVGAWLFWQPCLIVNSPELAKRILITDFDVFRNRFSSLAKGDPLGDNLFFAMEPMWSYIRRRLTKEFTSAKLKVFETLIEKKSKDLCQRINNEISKKQRTNLRSMYVDYTTDVVSIASFGINGDSVLTGDSPMRVVSRSFMKFPFLRGLTSSTIFFLPQLATMFGFMFYPKKATNYLMEIFRTVVRDRGGYSAPAQNKDFVDSLISLKTEAALEGKGKRFGVQMVQSALAEVALNYKFVPLPNSPKPEDCKMERNTVLMTTEDPLFVNFLPRLKKVE